MLVIVLADEVLEISVGIFWLHSTPSMCIRRRTTKMDGASVESRGI